MADKKEGIGRRIRRFVFPGQAQRQDLRELQIEQLRRSLEEEPQQPITETEFREGRRALSQQIGTAGVTPPPTSVTEAPRPLVSGAPVTEELALPFAQQQERIETLSKEEATKALAKKRLRPSKLSFREANQTITPQLSALTGGKIKVGQSNVTGFELKESIRANEKFVTQGLRQQREKRQESIRRLPAASLVIKIKDNRKGIIQLNLLKEMLRDAERQGIDLVGIGKGLLTEAKETLGFLTKAEADFRAKLLNQNAKTLRALGGTALTDTEKETYEKSFPLIGITPTDFIARTDNLIEELKLDEQLLKQISGELGRPVPDAPTQQFGSPEEVGRSNLPEDEKKRILKSQFGFID